MLGNETFFDSTGRQTAACKAVHKIEARTCKWPLRMHTLAGNDLQITQHFGANNRYLANQLAQVAGDLRADMITCPRARIHITDLA
jgi:hypothetical protein